YFVKQFSAFMGLRKAYHCFPSAKPPLLGGVALEAPRGGGSTAKILTRNFGDYSTILREQTWKKQDHQN
ncbi:hypothetical protein TELCIR_15467, partial [Teladorsagia circumcincta]